MLGPDRRWLGAGRLPRVASIVLALVALAIVGVAMAFLVVARPDLTAGSQGVALMAVAAVVVLLTVTTFVFPGYAYDADRAAEGYDYDDAPEPWSLRRAFSFLDTANGIEPGWLNAIMAALGTLGFFGITALGWYGWRYAQFLPMHGTVEWVAANGLFIRSGVFVVLGLTVALYPAAAGRWFHVHRRVVKLAMIVMMIVPALLAPMALTRGLPSLWATWFGHEAGTAEVVLVEPIAAARTWGCDRAARALPMGKAPVEVQVCNIPEAIWADLRTGDFLLLSGWQTGWGLQYFGYAVSK
jgi:hypothetical protein